ncbi:unnamed protein product [Ambrosiozyma monospora]|uniref:Unnamed protein product n=1 Tax=Ambrosiozyma monospora TaxID=43982 RepID=A0ACB5T972_AMBMO|nr:unnamed protein product [Ambrosiozyma monospora]
MDAPASASPTVAGNDNNTSNGHNSTTEANGNIANNESVKHEDAPSDSKTLSILPQNIHQTGLPRAVVYEILNQCYTRTVLPRANKLRDYKPFSNMVYGELMPSFLTQVYRDCGLNKEKSFIDLGSGVGNCTIQAALEFGCESYGVELAKNASILADAQLEEFQKRCALLGLKLPKIKLFGQQSFVDNPAVQEVVTNADVLLINNYLFDASLNLKIVELIQDLKPGSKIISLKPVVPPSYDLAWDPLSILARLDEKKYIYRENSVSWTSNGGYYYISEVKEEFCDRYTTSNPRHSRTRRSAANDLQSDGDSTREHTPSMNAFTNNF